MKRLLKLSGFVVLVTVINVVSLLVLIGPIMSSAGGGCAVGPGPAADCNGDVNGDGGVDIGDGVYLLNFLFAQGPAPVAFAGGLTPEQEEMLGHMSIVFLDDGVGGTVKTIRFTGVNVQIVNGLEATNGNPNCPNCETGTVNGLGNLIVGYNELLGTFRPPNHTGSHNVVVGTDNNYTSWGGLVAGFAHEIAGGWSSLSRVAFAY